MQYDLDFDEMSFGNDMALSVDMPLLDFGFAVAVRETLLPNVREALGNTKIPDTPEFRMCLQKIYDAYGALKKLHERLRTKVAGKLYKLSAFVKKVVPAFLLRSRARVHRSPTRSRAKSLMANDDGGSSESDSGDPPGPTFAFPVTPFRYFYLKKNSSSLTVVTPRQLLCGLSFFERRWAV